MVSIATDTREDIIKNTTSRALAGYNSQAINSKLLKTARTLGKRNKYMVFSDAKAYTAKLWGKQGDMQIL